AGIFGGKAPLHFHQRFWIVFVHARMLPVGAVVAKCIGLLRELESQIPFLLCSVWNENVNQAANAFGFEACRVSVRNIVSAWVTLSGHLLVTRSETGDALRNIFACESFPTLETGQIAARTNRGFQ
ncbi:MAG: hypothetical protein ABSF34_19195, partial [Verrucomicrobiota bacterium]